MVGISWLLCAALVLAALLPSGQGKALEGELSRSSKGTEELKNRDNDAAKTETVVFSAPLKKAPSSSKYMVKNTASSGRKSRSDDSLSPLQYSAFNVDQQVNLIRGIENVVEGARKDITEILTQNVADSMRMTEELIRVRSSRAGATTGSTGQEPPLDPASLVQTLMAQPPLTNLLRSLIRKPSPPSPVVPLPPVKPIPRPPPPPAKPLLEAPLPPLPALPPQVTNLLEALIPPKVKPPPPPYPKDPPPYPKDPPPVPPPPPPPLVPPPPPLKPIKPSLEGLPPLSPTLPPQLIELLESLKLPLDKPVVPTLADLPMKPTLAGLVPPVPALPPQMISVLEALLPPKGKPVPPPPPPPVAPPPPPLPVKPSPVEALKPALSPLPPQVTNILEALLVPKEKPLPPPPALRKL